ncbi:hypothetical protein L1987_65527 [Smallanthus sonchifolius]|uniref:Uncharacterized protein n=1 Tax=Smallanthus sonchifolius TaxID=185202 RepID=A0ACB9BUQ4_9ASTR|nr:hypothetical protein L1987_65527 [Smallanthus sonchifolius]
MCNARPCNGLHGRAKAQGIKQGTEDMVPGHGEQRRAMHDCVLGCTAVQPAIFSQLCLVASYGVSPTCACGQKNVVEGGGGGGWQWKLRLRWWGYGGGSGVGGLGGGCDGGGWWLTVVVEGSSCGSGGGWRLTVVVKMKVKGGSGGGSCGSGGGWRVAVDSGDGGWQLR